ncbi:MAG: endonuclease/exonuclease/phosphatase family protein [Gemmatimonadales bacterium]|nr:endonuclease/exonuclease/phosphatase family protein [Gemmatimonadales bacterium]
MTLAPPRRAIPGLGVEGIGWRQCRNYPEEAAPRLAVSAATPTPAPRDVLHVASFNIEMGRRVAAALEVVQAHPVLAGADVLTVQEVDESAVERLAGALGMHAVYRASTVHPRTGRNFGSAILTRWPIVDDGPLWLPGRGWVRGMRRLAVRATIAVHARPVHVYNLHLSTMWEMTMAGQDRQARAVAEEAAGLAEPVIVTGDFNRRGAVRELLRAGFHWHTRRVGPTHHVWSFDHVLSRGLGPGGGAGAVREALRASDHRAVWAEVPAPA